MNNKQRTRNLFFFTFVAAIGGFLFGFDTAVISGTIDALREKFQLSSLMEGWIVSSALLGCIIGAAAAGSLSDRFGRKKILILSGALFLISAIGSAVPQTVMFLIVARVIGGLGVGMASMLSPLYISEYSPASLRGRLVALYQFAIVIGILGAYLSNNLIVLHALQNEMAGNGFWGWIFTTESWRGMFFMETLPASLFLLLMLTIPESPRWLAGQGQTERAVSLLSKVLEPNEAEKEIRELTQLLDNEEGNFRELFKPGIRTALLIGMLLPFFSQVTGINIIIYYGTSIFKNIGLGIESAFAAQVIIGFINMTFTLLAIWKVDQLGRKPLLLTGAVGVSTILLLLGVFFRPDSGSGWFIALLFFLHVAVFAMSWGPVTWIVISEIFPTKIRGRAMSVGTLVIWISCALVAQTFPFMRDNLGALKTFLVYGLLLSPSVLLIWKKLPETKLKTLEEIEGHWNISGS